MVFKSVALYCGLQVILGWSVNPRKMSDSIRDSGFFVAVGILLAILIIGGIATAGFKIPALRFPGFVSDKGILIVQLTDAPADITHLNVTINYVQVQRENKTWQNLTFVDGVSKVSLDLLTLKDVVKNLSTSEITTGKYTKIRLGIEQANVTYTEGGWEEVKVPPKHIDIIVHFEIKEGETRTVLIDMMVEWIAISSSGNLRPVLKAEVKQIT